MEIREVHKLRDTIDGCSHPLVSIVPHCHICSRVTLHNVLTILFSLFHLVSIQAH